MQTRDAAVASLFVLLLALVILLILIYYVCKQRYKKPISIYRATSPQTPVTQIEDLSNDVVFNTPQIYYEVDESPPDYVDDGRGASPLPSYEDVIFCDQLNRSFQNLLSIP